MTQNFQEIRDAVRDLCAQFPNEYFRKVDEARASLREFMRRHPDAELPDDLRKLAATLPAD